MQGSRYIAPGTPRTRLERLIRERELRRLNRSGSVDDISNGANRDDDFSPFSNDGDGSSYFKEDGVMDGMSLEDCEREVRPKQRLLVVANRLPVSAIRKGDDSWQLEVSVGGLVSALLGNLLTTFFANCFTTYSGTAKAK